MISFVGAGPGAKDLITVRGRKLLEQADTVIYAGSLVNPALLEYTKKTCSIYNSAEMTLEQVMEIMYREAAADRALVRLHTGDPCLYGAVREQMDRLSEKNIPYEICPGVSSFCGAAASLRTEYTLPGVTQTVIITRAGGKTPVPAGESLTKLASHGATMVLFLSTGLLAQVQAALLQGAYTENTPCAIVYKATWEDEKIVRGTLGQLPQMASQNGIRKTALVVVGEFLGDEYELSRLYAADFPTEYRKASI